MSLSFGSKRPTKFSSGKIKTDDDSTVGSDRLHKLIQKNRKKREKQEGTPSANSSERKALGPSSKVYIPPSAPSFRGPSSLRPKTNSGSSLIEKRGNRKFFGYFLKFMWASILILFVHLIFTKRGVLDYYARQKNLEQKYENLKAIKVKNKELGIEIQKITKDKTYQKAIIRDYLGHITKDEYLILFQGKK